MKLKNIFYIIALILLFALGGMTWRLTHDRLHYGPHPGQISILTNPEFKGVIVTVGDRAITAEDLNWEYEQQMQSVQDSAKLTDIPATGLDEKKKAADIRQYLLSNLIERSLLYQYIKKKGDFKVDDPNRLKACKAGAENIVSDAEKKPDPEFLAKLTAQYCERAIITQYFDEKIAPTINITQAEMYEYFKNHKAEFNQPERVSIRQIVLAKEGDAKKVKNQLTKSNFSEMAAKYSIAPEAQKGGRLKPFAKGELPQSFNFVFSMPVGSMSDIVKSPYGFLIVILDSKKPAKEAQFETAQPEIRSRLTELKKKESYQAWINDALNAIPITPDSDGFSYPSSR